MPSNQFDIALNLDTKQFRAMAAEAAKTMNEISKTAASAVKMTVDVSDIDKAKSSLATLQDKKLKLDIDAADVEKKISELAPKIAGIESAKVKIDADILGLDRQIAQAKSKITTIQGKKLNLEVSDAAAKAEIEQFKQKIATLQDKKAILSLDKKQADADLSNFKAQMGTLQDKSVNIRTNTADVKAQMENVNAELSKVKVSDKKFTVKAEGLDKIKSGFAEMNKSFTGGFIGAAVGGAFMKGLSGLASGIGDIVEAGKKSLETSNNMKIAFAQAGVPAEQLGDTVTKAGSSIAKIASQFALPTAHVRELSLAAASLGGATGKANEDLVKLAVGMEKATNGAVDGTMAIKLFSKGVTDPESEMTLARLVKQFPALGAALKGIKDPAVATQKAIAFLNPTLSQMSEAAEGPLGATQKIQNSIASLKASLGKSLMVLIAPITDAFADYVIPVINTVTIAVNYVLKALEPIKPVLTSVGVIVGAVFGAFAIAAFVVQTNIWGIVSAQIAMIATNPFALAAIAVGALIASLVYLYQNVEFVRVAFDYVWEVIKAIGLGIWDVLKPVGALLMDIGSVILNYITMPFQIVYKVVSNVVSSIVGMFSSAEDSGGGFLDTIKSIFSAISEWVSDVQEFLEPVFSWINDAISEIADFIANIITPVVMFVLNGIIGYFTIVFNVIGFIAGIIWDIVSALYSVIATVVEWIAQTGVIQAVWGAVVAVFTTVYDIVASIVGFISDIVSGIGKFLGMDTGGKGEEDGKNYKKGFEKTASGIEYDTKAPDLSDVITDFKELQDKAKINLQFEADLDSLEKSKTEIANIQAQIAAAQAKGAPSAEIDALNAKLSEAQTLTNELSSKFAKEMPSAVTGTRQETVKLADGTSKLKTVYDINTAAVKNHVEAKKGEYDSKMQLAQSQFIESLKKEGAEYEKQKKKLGKIELKIQAGTATKEDMAEYDKLSNEIREKLVNKLKEAQAAGLDTAGAVDTISKALGITTDEATALLKAQEKVNKAIEKGGIDAKKLADAFDKAKSSASGVQSQELSKVAQMNLVRGMSEEAFQKFKVGLASDTEREMYENVKRMSDAKYKDEVKKLQAANKDMRKLDIAEQKAKDAIDTEGRIKRAEEDKIFKLDEEKRQKERNAREIKDETKKEEELLKITQWYDVEKQNIVIESAQRTLNMKPDAANAQALQAAQEALKSIVEKNANALDELNQKNNEKRFKTTQDTYKRELEMQKQLESARLGSLKDFVERGVASVQQINEYSTLQMKSFMDTQAEKITKIVESTPLYQEQVKEIEVDVKAGKVDPKDAIAKIEELKKLITEQFMAGQTTDKATSAMIQELAKQSAYEAAQQQLKINEQTQFALRQAKLRDIKDLTEYEYEYSKLENDKLLTQKLADAKGNYVLELKAFEEYIAKKEEAEKGYEKKRKAAAGATLGEELKAYQKELTELFADSVKDIKFDFNVSDEVKKQTDAVKNQTNAALEGIKNEEKLALQSYKNKAIGYNDYIRKMNDLDKKRAEEKKKQDEAMAKSEKTVWDGLIAGVNSAIANTFKKFSDNRAKERAEFVSLYTDQAGSKLKAEKTIAEIEKKYGNDRTKMTESQSRAYDAAIDAKNAKELTSGEITKEVFTNVMETAGTAMFTAVANGENAMKAMVNGMLDALSAMVPVLTTQILALIMAQPWSIAGMEIPGWAVFGAVQVALQGLLGAAKAAVNGAFATGGQVHGGQQLITINELGEEFVMNHRTTRKNLKAFEQINKSDLTVEEWFVRNYNLSGLIDSRINNAHKLLLSNFRTFDNTLYAFASKNAAGLINGGNGNTNTDKWITTLNNFTNRLASIEQTVQTMPEKVKLEKYQKIDVAMPTPNVNVKIENRNWR